MNDSNGDMVDDAVFEDLHFDSKLAILRAENPYIPILKFPDAVLNFVMTANVAQDVNIPSGAKLVRFAGSADYYVQRNGAAQVPTASLTGDLSTMGALLKPEYAFFAAQEMGQLSIVAPTTGTIVTVHCYFGL